MDNFHIVVLSDKDDDLKASGGKAVAYKVTNRPAWALCGK
jgi:hypothetical protein